MILESLVKYYEALLKKKEVCKPGWCKARVSYALSLAENGELSDIINLKIEIDKGKKNTLAAQYLEVPEMISRSGDKSISNFLCDNASYFLGVDSKGNLTKSKRNFKAAKDLHIDILKSVDNREAKAVIAFFQNWDVENAADNILIKNHWDELISGSNLIFRIGGKYIQDMSDIKAIWDVRYKHREAEYQGRCLVTGEYTDIARTHGSIRGIYGAQSAGAMLVSFNEKAFESYGKEQSLNAPVGKYAVFAYTTAINYLLTNNHYTRIGDSTILYWADDAEPSYQTVFKAIQQPTSDNQSVVKDVFNNIAAGKAISMNGVNKSLSSSQKFYILSIAPNAARLSIRFFYEDSFGNILKNIQDHYDRMCIVRPVFDPFEYIGLWKMLQETVNQKAKDKTPVPNMASSTFRAIILNEKYPASLIYNTIIRIRAEQDDSEKHTSKINRGRAAIIKAYLLKNTNIKKEELTMGLNEDSTNIAYILGREFSVLEEIQEASAINKLNTTIKDRYFNSACATPAIIFPILFKLKNSHTRKIRDNVGQKIKFEQLLTELQGKIALQCDDTLPKRLTLEEQGMFILGYYHQTQKRYEPKNKEEKDDE